MWNVGTPPSIRQDIVLYCISHSTATVAFTAPSQIRTRFGKNKKKWDAHSHNQTYIPTHTKHCRYMMVPTQSGVDASISRFNSRWKHRPLRSVRSVESWLWSAGAREQKRRFPASVLDLGTWSRPSCLVLRSRTSAFWRRTAASDSGSPLWSTLCARHSVV